MRIVVVGIGNTWASDDRVGVEVVQRLKESLSTSSPNKNISFEILEHATVELIDLMAACDRLIVVDAIVSGARPGTIHHQVWQPDMLESRGTERASSHGFGVREILELAVALERLPTQVLLWGVEVESTRSGLSLSPTVVKALPLIVEQIRNVLSESAPNG